MSDRIWSLWQDLRYDHGYPDDGLIIDRNCKKIEYYNSTDKIFPWQNEAESKSIENVLEHRNLNYSGVLRKVKS